MQTFQVYAMCQKIPEIQLDLKLNTGVFVFVNSPLPTPPPTYRISKHLKGQLGPRVGDVTFFNHGGQLGACVGDVTFFNHVGQLGPCVGDVTFFNHVGQLGPHVDDVTSTHEKPTKNMKNWFAWFFKVVSWLRDSA